ncbi:DUF1330 domain-containing protein [Nocardioides sp. GY 10127]|uniref:DUF1330 domain-containing protein n=1 Tax=Nocardioides sp. GY 10127 TaxID=2569762 RepID=UPI0010A91B5F|nr:DUF1330 domain-containing protein [Nocardioides sp. GY 10127]TIC86421.1 DUF1330 domain-containing protein [Nocardioides sp. GY 10127]
MTAYWVSCYREISDPEKLAAYAAISVPALEAAGGVVVARGMPGAVYEAGLMQRTTVLTFPDVETAVAAHDSEAYQRALEALGDGAVRDLRIVPGV